MLICILFGGWSDNGAEGLKYGRTPIPCVDIGLDRSLEIKFQTVRPEYQAACPYKSQTNPYFLSFSFPPLWREHGVPNEGRKWSNDGDKR